MIFDDTAGTDRAGITGDKLDHLAAIMHSELPNDETVAEVHILRAIVAVTESTASIEDILRWEVSSY